ncbi:MAG TPA: complex I subunit 1 family protein [Acidimicrobiales bacterium]|jgi:NADH-quinone oxidoreductase subunit H|nr:complex I subunit 1 family protein [Acidimicrobiales bacterium]
MVGDPIFAHGLTLAVWIVLVVKVIAVFAIVLVSVLFMVMYERKAVAALGNRPGPNRAGPGGWLQSLADGTKLFFKEAFIPTRADKAVYKIAPFIALLPAILAISVVPLGGTIHLGHNLDTRLQLADPPWGVLFLLMTSAVAVYGVMLAGWASASKYSLFGAVRASAQMVSYESAIGLTTATVVLLTGSLHTSAITAAQKPGFLYNWNIIHAGIVPFVIFFIAITAEMTRAPFDLVEAEEEISGGFNIEYGSVGFALFYLAEYANLVVNSTIITTLWLGGPDGPQIDHFSIGPFWFALKVLILLYIFVWIRATLPRLRYDQLMDLGWKRLIPLALAWLMVVAAFQVSRWYGVAAIGASLLGGALLWRAIDVGKEASALEAATPTGEKRSIP